MRPKKKILIASSFEIRASVLRLVLSTNRYAVSVATCEADALAQLAAWSPELVIIDLPFSGLASLVSNAGDGGGATTLAIGKLADLAEEVPFNAALPREYVPAELLRYCKLLAGRKRGPRPLKKPVTSVPAIAADLVVNL